MFDPKMFMQMAIDEMKKSIAEPRTDGKVSPTVGAILLTPDGLLHSSAHRGEIRNGEHAEYTLLDKKLRDKPLSSWILFTTLEPCAPGARNHPKLACAERIVNARIGKVYIGIEDPDPNVDRKGIKYLQDSGIEVEMFNKEFQEIIYNDNKEYIRQAKLRNFESKKPKLPQLSPLENAIENSSVEEFSQEALLHYINRAELKMKSESSEFLDLLERQQLIQSDSDQPKNKSDLLAEEIRKNDVLPIFDVQEGGLTGQGRFEVDIINKGERASVLSYQEYPDNGSYIQIQKGLIEKGQRWLISGNSKTGAVDSNTITVYKLAQNC